MKIMQSWPLCDHVNVFVMLDYIFSPLLFTFLANNLMAVLLNSISISLDFMAKFLFSGK